MSEAKSRAEPGAAVESSSPDREEEQQPVRGRCSREGGALRSRSRSREEGAEGRAAREAADGEAGDPRASAASSTASKDNDGAKTTTTTQKNKSKKKKSKKNSRLKFYRQLKRIGKGSYGVVDLVRGKDNRLYVMKVVQNTEGKVTAGGHTQEARAEAEMLQTLRHPNIVEFHEAFVESRYLCLVMAYCRSGDLKGRVKRAKSRNKLFKEQTIMDWFVQMCFGLNYMHKKHIMHRDLKPQNVFLTENNKIVKLGDFGVTRELNSTQALAKTQVGTPYYMSPELARNEQYSFQSDVWALGCILSETCTLSVPFDAENFPELVTKITNSQPRQLHKCYSQKLRNLVTSMLAKDPQDRPTTDRVLRNEFVQEHIRSFSERYQEHYGRVQPVTPNVDAYSPRRPNAKVVAGGLESASDAGNGAAVVPAGTQSGRDDDKSPSAGAGAGDAVVEEKRARNSVPPAKIVGDQEPRHAAVAAANARRKAAELSSTLDERDVKIHDIKQRLKLWNNGVIESDKRGGGADGEGRHPMSSANERQALTASLKKLMAEQVRDATALSQYQDQIENREGQELKQVLQYCEENLRVAEERRQATAKVENMLKASLGHDSPVSSARLKVGQPAASPAARRLAPRVGSSVLTPRAKLAAAAAAAKRKQLQRQQQDRQRQKRVQELQQKELVLDVQNSAPSHSAHRPIAHRSQQAAKVTGQTLSSPAGVDTPEILKHLRVRTPGTGGSSHSQASQATPDRTPEVHQGPSTNATPTSSSTPTAIRRGSASIKEILHTDASHVRVVGVGASSLSPAHRSAAPSSGVPLPVDAAARKRTDPKSSEGSGHVLAAQHAGIERRNSGEILKAAAAQIVQKAVTKVGDNRRAVDARDRRLHHGRDTKERDRAQGNAQRTASSGRRDHKHPQARQNDHHRRGIPPAASSSSASRSTSSSRRQRRDKRSSSNSRGTSEEDLRPGTSDLETTRGSLAASLSAERPSTASSDIMKKSNFLSGVDPKLLEISHLQAKKAVLQKLPTPPTTLQQLSGPLRPAFPAQRRKLPVGGKLAPVIGPS